MESRVIFQDGMDNDPADYNTLQDFTQDAIDHIVAHGISAERKYAGFAASKTANAVVTVNPGFFFSGGKVYVARDAFVKDFTTSLPVASKKIVMVVGYGQESQIDERPREFLLNEESGASEPRVVAMELARLCNVNTVQGSESPDPVEPMLDAGVLAIAKIVLGNTGVISVEMVAGNKLDSVQSLSDRTKSLETFRTETSPQIVSLSSDLAALKVASTGAVNSQSYGRVLTRLAATEAKLGIPSTAVASAADFFLDKSRSDTAHASFSAKVAEGIRFAEEAGAEVALAIFDSLNPKAMIKSGVMLPAYDRVRRLEVGPHQGEIQVSAYSYQANSLVQKTESRTRIRYGEEFIVSSSSGWFLSGSYDWLTETLSKDGETFNVIDNDGKRIITSNDSVRVRRYWYDTVETPYWTSVTTSSTVNGALVAETFLNANDMWLDAIGLTFTRLAATGGITLAVCEVGNNGAPDLKKVVSKTEVAREGLLLNAETVIPVKPVFLQGGTRYAFVVISAADHWLATTGGENFTQGTLFYVLDGAYQQGDGTRDLVFNIYAAKFRQSRAVIEMNALTLGGGITSLDILAGSIVPGSSALVYEIQVAGIWYPVQDVNESVLGAGGNIPVVLPLRAVFIGTPDVMPSVTLTGSRVRVSRPKLTMTHVSTARTLAAPSTQIRVIARLENFDAAHHTAVCKLRSDGTFSTVTAATSFSDTATTDGAIERTWLFNLGGSISAYKIQLEGTTDAVLIPFIYAARKDYAL